MKNLLLLSNSTNAGESFLEYAIGEIRQFLGRSVKSAIFIPYAGVTIDWDVYADKVSAKFLEFDYKIQAIHHASNPKQAIEEAEAIVVGGGNTWQLLHLIYENELLEAIQQKVNSGTPYIGWSAGSNLACPSIRTTNDMPIVEPRSFKALNLVPFQINPHFIDIMPAGHAGETREDRINEFIKVNPEISVLGLREGTMLKVDDKQIRLIGPHNAKVFRFGCETRLLDAGILDPF
jgi:dipeptidase E